MSKMSPEDQIDLIRRSAAMGVDGAKADPEDQPFMAAVDAKVAEFKKDLREHFHPLFMAQEEQG